MDEVENLKNKNLLNSLKYLYNTIKLNLRFLALLSFSFVIVGFFTPQHFQPHSRFMLRFNLLNHSKGRLVQIHLIYFKLMLRPMTWHISKVKCFHQVSLRYCGMKDMLKLFLVVFMESTDKYLRNPGLLEVIKSKILSYEIDKTVDHVNLSEMLGDTFVMKKIKRLSFICNLYIKQST